MTIFDSGNSETEQCVHEPCRCVVENATGEDAYCGDSCRNADGREEEMNCLCGHPPCDSP